MLSTTRASIVLILLPLLALSSGCPTALTPSCAGCGATAKECAMYTELLACLIRSQTYDPDQVPTCPDLVGAARQDYADLCAEAPDDPDVCTTYDEFLDLWIQGIRLLWGQPGGCL